MMPHHFKISLLWVFTCLGVCGVCRAFPVVIEAQNLPRFIQTQRNQIFAFSLDSSGRAKRIPLQIEEVENGAALIFRNPTGSPDNFKERQKLPHPKSTDPFQGKLYGIVGDSESIHRLVLNDKDFAFCDASCAAKAQVGAQTICGATSMDPLVVSKIDLRLKKTSAFIVNCQRTLPPLELSKVKVDLKKKEFTADTYKYKYISDDNIMLDSLMSGKEEIFKQNDLLINMLPASFIMPNVSFTQKSLNSKVTSYTRGPLSLGVEFAMSAKLLGFLRLPNQICCDISFYQDAFYLPIMLNLTSKGSDFKVGSSLIYGLNYQGNVDTDINLHLPKLAPNGKAKLPTPHGPEGAALLINKGEKAIAVGFGNTKRGQPPPSYVRSGDLDKFKFKEKLNAKIGVYFDMTSMGKGDQIFRFWFYFGDKEERNTLLEYAKNGVEYNVYEIYQSI